MHQNVLEKFLRYVAVDTQSDENSESSPSTAKQLDLARILKKELEELGLKKVSLDKFGYVMAELPANTKKKVPAIGFIAHMDTSPDMPGVNIKHRIIKNYDGKDIVLNKELAVSIATAEFPEIRQYKGQTLIVTDGTTLLGADDKAGIAEIMTAVEHLVKHPEIEHGAIKIGFTPDEEVGRGVDNFDVKKFGADFAYTMDGGAVGELEYENFNAAMASITIQGRNIHPGYAKDRMKNAIIIGIELNEMLPVDQRPEFTVGYEGFFHIMKFDGSVEKAAMKYIIRDHDRAKLEQKKAFITRVTEFLNRKYGAGTVTLELKDQYYNMREKVEPVFHVVETARKAMELCGVEPKVVPIRGGTDGARLSYMGLPCPNIFAGGHNFHGKLEYVAVGSMEKAVEVILKIVELYAKK